MDKHHFSQGKWLLLYPLPIAALISFLLLKHTPSIFLGGTIVLYLFGLLFVYKKARWLIFFILSFVPMSVASLLVDKNISFSVGGQIIFWIFFLLSLAVDYFLALKWKIIPKISRKHFPLSKILLGFALLWVASAISNIVGQLTQSGTTENQTAINLLGLMLPMSIFAVQTIFAGFFEELAFRVGIFEIVFKENKIVAAIAAFLFFTILHGPTDLYSWVTYGTMSLVLTGLYAKYRNFYLNMSVHMLWNFIGVLAIFYVTHQ